ncbi:MAG: TetR/AcrR family transcriptional regulator [Deltaproteobacteria bacterium]|nr:TetR/AcrR family transcriptional regulator [Deltaproteobacteria bacterium]
MASEAHPKARPSQTRLSSPAIGTKRAAGGDKREAILDAALELFVERGFFGTAVPEIADRAGVGAGTIYRYFESKEALVNAIYRQQKLHFANVVLDGFPRAANTRELFRQLWMRMAKFATENTNAFIFLELHHHQRYLDDESRAVENRMLDLFTGVVTQAQARGELKLGPPRLLMGLVMGAFVGVTRSCVEIDQALDSADWKLAEQCIWEAVRS